MRVLGKKARVWGALNTPPSRLFMVKLLLKDRWIFYYSKETVKMDQSDENPNLEINLTEPKILQYCPADEVEGSNCPSPDPHISTRRCSSGRISCYKLEEIQ